MECASELGLECSLELGGMFSLLLKDRVWMRVAASAAMAILPAVEASSGLGAGPVCMAATGWRKKTTTRQGMRWVGACPLKISVDFAVPLSLGRRQSRGLPVLNLLRIFWNPAVGQFVGTNFLDKVSWSWRFHFLESSDAGFEIRREVDFGTSCCS